MNRRYPVLTDGGVLAEEHNAALVRRAVAAIWKRGELDLANMLFGADYINHAGLIPDLLRGPEAIKISVALYRTAFPNLQITVDALTAKRDTVLLRWTARSSASRATQGMLTGIIVSRCGAEIVENWIAWNQGRARTAGPRPSCGGIRPGADTCWVLPLVGVPDMPGTLFRHASTTAPSRP